MVGAQSVADLKNPVKGEILQIFLTNCWKSLYGLFMLIDKQIPHLNKTSSLSCFQVSDV